ncbi:MAG: sodium:proton antiporter NhaD [Tannerella sp.]|nr:sodium:proton antiporter NhaD [Tannerella sp.]
MYSTLMIIIFVLGYAMIALEHQLKINKTATALFLAVVLWSVFSLSGNLTDTAVLVQHLGETSEILFFLLGAMTIVETVDRHNGFALITNRITTTDKRRLLWVVSLLTFFMSSVLDNLTTAIVMYALLRKLVADRKDRWFFAGMVILAANAGGAWTPIGDVTTIMLWIKGNITTAAIMMNTFLPSIVSLLVPLTVISFRMKGSVERPAPVEAPAEDQIPKLQSDIIFLLGVGSLLFTPVFKSITHLPPYFGILFGLSVLWIVTEIMHRKNSHYSQLNIASIIQKVDTPSVLFFLGILMAVTCLQSAGHLGLLADELNKLNDVYLINTVIGLLSSVIDNVPLVAAAMGMYPVADAAAVLANPDLTHFMVDGAFWEMLAYCAGTGGSILIIGSAAGVAIMGMEKIDFIWYMKKISLWALTGYLAGAGTFYLMSRFLFHT